jgi:hypothetical protein
MQQPKYPKKGTSDIEAAMQSEKQSQPNKPKSGMLGPDERYNHDHAMKMEMRKMPKNYKSGNGWSSPGNPNLEGS